MYLINQEENKLEKLEEVTFSELGFREREHLQEWIAKEPNVLGEELLIIQKEFDGFSDTRERLDLLALDKDGNLVIIENKLDDSGRDVTWQALKYASYCSSLSKEDIRNIYQDYLTKEGINEPAEEKLSEFYEAEYEDILLNRSLSQRIVLVAVNFRKEVTSTVLWLLNYNINMQCFKVTPSRKGNELFLSFDQIIPMEEAEDYIIKMAEKAQDDISDANIKNSRDDLKYEFWIYLLEEMNKKSDLFRNISPQKSSAIGTGSGIGGVTYYFIISKTSPRVELYIDTGNKEKNKSIFDYLFERKEIIEENFDNKLVWQRKDDKKLCRIKYEIKANGFDKEQWKKIANFMVDSMIKLEETLREHIEEVRRLLDNGNL